MSNCGELLLRNCWQAHDLACITSQNNDLKPVSKLNLLRPQYFPCQLGLRRWELPKISSKDQAKQGGADSQAVHRICQGLVLIHVGPPIHLNIITKRQRLILLEGWPPASQPTPENDSYTSCTKAPSNTCNVILTKHDSIKSWTRCVKL